MLSKKRKRIISVIKKDFLKVFFILNEAKFFSFRLILLPIIVNNTENKYQEV